MVPGPSNTQKLSLSNLIQSKKAGISCYCLTNMSVSPHIRLERTSPASPQCPVQYRRSVFWVFVAILCIASASIPLYSEGQVAHAAAPAPAFSDPLTVTGGQHPNFIATGDFNEDGWLDLAVTNQNSSNVSILLANGTSGFNSATNYPLAPNIFAFPRAIAVADFNGDAHLDYVTVSSLNFEGNAFVRLGNCNGTFRDPTKFVTGNIAVFVVLADFGHDGKVDMAVANQGGDFVMGEGGVVHLPATVAVLAGDGQGGFAAPQALVSYSSPKVPTALSVGDFNNDGLPDLAVTNNNSKVSGADPAVDSVTVLLNQITSSLRIVHDIPVANGPHFLINHDLDNDGELDLAVTGKGTDTISVLRGNGRGDFDAPSTFPAGGSRGSLAAGDFNGDGHVDLATTSSRLYIILGAGNGSLGPPVEYLNRNYSFVLVSDLNRDRKPDILLADTNGEFFNQVSVLFNTSDFQPASPWLLTQETTARAIALDSVTSQRDPFRICGTHNFSADKLTRVMLFTYDDVTAMAGGDRSLVTAQAEDAQGTIYLLTIEYVGKLPNSGGLTQIVVKLADSIRLLDKIWITVTVRGVPGNRVLLRIDASDCSPT